MKLKKIYLICSIAITSTMVFADGTFPPSDNSSQNLTLPQVVSPNGQISNIQANSTTTLNGANDMKIVAPTTPIGGVVPQMNQNTSVQDPVNSGKVVVNQNGSSQVPSTFSQSDQITNDLNTIKKQKAMNDLKASMKQGSNSYTPPMSSTTSVAEEPLKPISATMIGYIISNNKVKIATIQYADNSTIDVQIGSLVSGYKVSQITTDKITLNKYDKSVSGKNVVVLRKSNPSVMMPGNQGGGAVYNVGQSLDMEKITKTN